ncbi:MAG: hypothetical protein JWR38_3254 [Mucilaginibacter sp.]|nr:hypothetical protein [Mucilaginibacter sp.]
MFYNCYSFQSFLCVQGEPRFFAEARACGIRRLAEGRETAAHGSAWFAGQRPRAQRSISADLIYSLIVCFFSGAHYLASPYVLVTLYQDIRRSHLEYL